jgi:hypothetical protein
MNMMLLFANVQCECANNVIVDICKSQHSSATK